MEATENLYKATGYSSSLQLLPFRLFFLVCLERGGGLVSCWNCVAGNKYRLLLFRLEKAPECNSNNPTHDKLKLGLS